MEMLIAFSILAMFTLPVPFARYLYDGGGRGARWGMVAAGREARGVGYRATSNQRWKDGAAPPIVRIAAFTSFFLGQMIVPGALAALLGFAISVVGLASGRPEPLVVLTELSAPTGLFVAASLLSAGSAMLRRAPDAGAAARRAVRWALGHNLALLLGLVVVGVAESAQSPTAHLAVLAPFALYATVSIAQALVVRAAARALQAYDARQSEDRVEPSDLLAA
jgi:hypothetical protein